MQLRRKLKVSIGVAVTQLFLVDCVLHRANTLSHSREESVSKTRYIHSMIYCAFAQLVQVRLSR
jgi:hypothetical protein